MTAGTPGKINMRLVKTNPNTSAIIYNVNTTVNYGCTADEFKDALNVFSSFSSYQISVTRTIYDGSNAIINDTATASKI